MTRAESVMIRDEKSLANTSTNSDIDKVLGTAAAETSFSTDGKSALRRPAAHRESTSFKGTIDSKKSFRWKNMASNIDTIEEYDDLDFGDVNEEKLACHHCFKLY